jgi:hypothetical protein
METKVIRNDSLQTLEVYLLTPKGLKSYLFQPHDAKIVPASFITEHVKKLQKRRLITISNN